MVVSEISQDVVEVFDVYLLSDTDDRFGIKCVVYPPGPALNDLQNRDEVKDWAKAYQRIRYGSLENAIKMQGTLFYREDKAPRNFFRIGKDVSESRAATLSRGDKAIVSGVVSHCESIGTDVSVHVVNCTFLPAD